MKQGAVSTGLTDITDILPTLADFAGIKTPGSQRLDGKSLAPLLRGETTEHRPWIFSFLADGRILRDSRWLLELRGDGSERFLDCGDRRDGRGYKIVTESQRPEVLAARDRFTKLLADLPGPTGYPGLRVSSKGQLNSPKEE